MICIKCGQEFDEGTKFCTKCGFGVSNTAPGNKILKISGVLFIIVGAFGIISLITSIVTNLIASEMGVPEISSFTIILNVLNVLLCLFFGITGVMYCNDIKKAKSLKYFAFGYFGFYVISSVNGIITTVANLEIVPGGGAILFMVFGIIIGFIIPILYLIGAQKNIKAQEGQ